MRKLEAEAMHQVMIAGKHEKEERRHTAGGRRDRSAERWPCSRPGSIVYTRVRMSFEIATKKPTYNLGLLRRLDVFRLTDIVFVFLLDDLLDGCELAVPRRRFLIVE